MELISFYDIFDKWLIKYKNKYPWKLHKIFDWIDVDVIRYEKLHRKEC